jgi:hypothetical protein
MSHESKIKQAIMHGMAQACEDMSSFCDQPEKQFNAEYLFTVATARAISDLNGPPADPYKIKIEHATKQLGRDCLKPFVRQAGALQKGSTILRHKHAIPSVSRNGRVDIAIYDDGYNSGYFGEKPLCVIELKGFNPPKHQILQDVRRNLQFHRLNGATGASVLSFSYFAALHSRAPQFSHKSPSAIKGLYEKLLVQLGAIVDFSIEVDTFTVSLDNQGRLYEEVSETVIDLSTMHHYIGVIVGIKQLSSALA